MSREPEWTMPGWMEPYREMFQNTGGNSIEDLMRDTMTDAYTNAVRSLLIVAVDSQVTLLTRMHSAGLLPDTHGDSYRWVWNSSAKAWDKKALGPDGSERRER